MSISESQIVLCGHGSGNPSLKNMNSYLSSRYSSIADNGKRKGLVSVKRLKGMTDSNREKFSRKYKTIIGRNIYDQNLRGYVYTPYKNGKYYSDCSSSICATMREIGYGSVPLLNTAGIYNSSMFENVPVKISNGHVMNPEVLKVADCLLFVGNDSSRPLQIGHVEAIYSIPIQDTIFTETEILGESIEITANLNIRDIPTTNGKIVDIYKKNSKVRVTAKSGNWFKTDKGWISRNYCKGWILEDDKWWYIDNGKYPMFCAMDIEGKEYHFDKSGWMLTGDRLSASGDVIY